MKKNNNLVTLGPDGSYSQMVANNIIIPGSGIITDLITIPSDVTKMVRDIAGNTFAATLGNLKVITKIPSSLAGVVPIHNTYGHTVNLAPEAIYQIIRNETLNSMGWYSLKIVHILACLEGTNLENLKSIHSHSQAISQCLNEGIARLGNDIKLVNEQSTTTHIQDLKIGEAVICNSTAAKNAGLKILDDSFGPNENTTDFLILSQYEEIEGLQNLTHEKVMIIISLINKPGSLVRGLALLSEARVNMRSIHSQTKSPCNTDFIVITDNNNCDWDSIGIELKKQGGTIKIL